MFSSASGFSILATIRVVDLHGYQLMPRRISMSLALRTNDNATQSTFMLPTKFQVSRAFLSQGRGRYFEYGG